MNETIHYFQDPIIDFIFNIISYLIQVLLYGFNAIDYSIESAIFCPEIPSFEVAFCQMWILVPEIAKSQFDLTYVLKLILRLMGPECEKYYAEEC